MKTISLWFIASSLSFIFCDFAIAQLKADFALSRAIAGINVDIDFTYLPDSSGAIIIDHRWSISDGTNFVALEKVTHHFEKAGDYDITLIVSDVLGNQASVTKKIQILENRFPSADFYFQQNEILSGTDIAFISQAKDEDNNIDRYEWFTDAALEPAGSKKLFVTKFAAPGKYKIRHVVTDSLGAKAEIEKEIQVLEVNQPPTIEVDFPSEVIVGELTVIKVKARDPDGKITSGNWKLNGFPEGPFSSNKIEVIFPLERTFHLTVTVTDNRGAQASASAQIFARNSQKTPSVKIKPSSEKVGAGKSIGFWGDYSSDSNSLQEIQWDFGDGISAISKKPNVEHIYSVPGLYNAKAKFIFDKQKAAETQVEIQVLGDLNPVTVPTQVVINTRNYIEIIPSQTTTINFSAFTNASQIYSYSTPVWNLSNSHIQVNSTAWNSAVIQGLTAGETTLSVTVDGITSQSITIKVLDFVNDAIVTQRGRFLGGSQDKFCFFINRNTNSTIYNLTHSFMSPDWLSNSGVGSSNKVGACLNADIPAEKNAIQFMAPNESLAYTKQIPNVFNGRNGFLSFPSATNLQINYNDDRFVTWSNDFSITYWALSGGDGSYYGYQQIIPRISGSFSLLPYGAVGSIVTTGSNGSAYLYAPNGDDFKNRWVHLGLTYSSSTRILKLYVDGEWVGSITVPTGDLGQTGSIVLGPTGYSYGTAVDELRFWGKALSSTEISYEMFSPANVSSSDLLADFNFDHGFDGSQESANGSGWTFELQDQAGTTAPQPRNVQIPLLEQNISASQKTKLEAKIPYGEFAGKTVSIMADAGSFSADERIIVQASTCQTNCSNENLPYPLKDSRASLYFYINTLKRLQTSVLLKIPFDVQSINPVDLKKIKVMQYKLNGWGNEYNVLEPREINSIEGYVSIDTYGGGVYWVSLFNQALPQFTNNDLKPAFGGVGGSRFFYTSIPSSQGTYVVTGETNAFYGYYTITSYCNVAGVTANISGDTLTISGLQNGANLCALTYWNYDYLGSYYYNFDLFMITKGNP